jgi:hypothetical protein
MLRALYPEGSEFAADLFGYVGRTESLLDQLCNLRKDLGRKYSATPSYRFARHRVRPIYSVCLIHAQARQPFMQEP